MKHIILITFLLIARVSLLGQAPNNIKIQLPNDIFTSRYVSINGDFYGQVPAFEKKEEGSDSVLFKTEGGLLQITVYGTMIRDNQNKVTICLFTNEIQGENPRISATINKKTVPYEPEGKGFGFYVGKDKYINDYIIITRLNLRAEGYPDYYLEFPVIVQLTPAGNIDNTASFIPDVTEHFRLYRAARK